jgi:hypothetical protein
MRIIRTVVRLLFVPGGISGGLFDGSQGSDQGGCEFAGRVSGSEAGTGQRSASAGGGKTELVTLYRAGDLGSQFSESFSNIYPGDHQVPGLASTKCPLHDSWLEARSGELVRYGAARII